MSFTSSESDGAQGRSRAAIPPALKACLVLAGILFLFLLGWLWLFFSLLFGSGGGERGKAERRFVEIPAEPGAHHPGRQPDSSGTSAARSETTDTGLPRRPELVSRESRVAQQARSIVGELETPEEQAYALFAWIAENIAYDIKGLQNLDKLPSQEAEAVLERRNGVCQGYAELFKAMARAVELEAQVVGGKVRRRSSGDMVGEGERHAWNAVRVGERWLLLDPTWGAGSANQERTEFRFDFKPHWFDVPPEQLILSHFPDEQKWQFLDKPLTHEEFEEQMLVRPPFFSLGLTVHQGIGPRMTVEDEFELTIDAEQDCEFSARLESGERTVETHPVQVRHLGNSARLRATFPGPGEYELVVFAGPPGESRQKVLSIWLQVRRGGSSPLPRTWPAYDEYGVSLLSPQDSGIQVQSQAQVQLTLARPGRVTASLEFQGQRLDEYPVAVIEHRERFELLATFPEAGLYELVIFIGESKDHPRSRAVSFQFQAKGGGAPLPRLYSAFNEWGGSSFLPRRPLRKEQTESLQIELPGALEAYAFVDGERSYLRKDGVKFEGVLVASGSEVTIFGLDRKEGSEKAILRYLVEP